MTKLGLRIDVDTFRGTRYGVPNLLKILEKYHIKASFFFSVGPDNMGRHLWRLLRPSFFRKILRSKAASLYGWDILLRGTLWQGPVIGEKLSNVIRAASEAGHEIGFHAWDHHAWQTRFDSVCHNTAQEWEREFINKFINKGVTSLTRITGTPPSCSAAPAWKCNDLVLLEKTHFPFIYNSDCRGEHMFYPLVNGKKLHQPQIPVTLPTYDEVIGSNGISDKNYNEYMLSLIKPEKLNVLTIHAEVEGIACVEMFEQFITLASSRNISFIPLGTFLSEPSDIACSVIIPEEIQGREGWVACQA